MCQVRIHGRGGFAEAFDRPSGGLLRTEECPCGAIEIEPEAIW